MGNLGGKSKINKEQKIPFKELLQPTQRNVLQLLFVGPGESGKSTIVKQLLILHKGGFPIDIRREYVENISRNLLYGAKQIVSAIKDLGIPQEDENAKLAGERLATLYKTGPFKLNDAVVADLMLLRDCQAAQIALERSAEFHLEDSWPVYIRRLEKYPEWGGKNWIPTDDDILHSRVMTSGVQQTPITASQQNFNIIDTGGQRAERAKWLSLFSAVHAMVFVASLSGYNQKLYEDRSTNRLTEALTMWKRTTREPALRGAALVVFLNKFDLFQDKYFVKQIPIEKPLPNSEQPPTYDQEEDDQCKQALLWFKKEFRREMDGGHDHLRVTFHITTAVDTKGMQLITSAVIGNILAEHGMMVGQI